MKTPLNCDQVAWMLAAINRYLPPQAAPNVSRARDMQGYALLYELMEVAHLCFEDDAAARNGTPRDVFMLREKTAEQTEAQHEGMTIAGGAVTGGSLGQLMREQYSARGGVA